jgi:L-fuculose-phosphate aldolase
VKYQDLREEVAEVARQMVSSGLVTGTSGNVSARTPEGDVLITPSGLDYSSMQPENVVLVSVRGDILEGSLQPSTETPMHTGSRYATTLACLGLEIPPVHYMLTTLSSEGRIPLAPYATYGTGELASYAAGALGESHNACLLQNHGAITVGESAGQAFSRTVTLEEMAEIYYRARLAGEPILLTPEQIQEVATKIAGYGQAKPLSAGTD